MPSYLKNSPLALCNKYVALPFILPNRMNKKDCSINVNVVDDDGFMVHYNGKRHLFISCLLFMLVTFFSIKNKIKYFFGKDWG